MYISLDTANLRQDTVAPSKPFAMYLLLYTPCIPKYACSFSHQCPAHTPALALYNHTLILPKQTSVLCAHIQITSGAHHMPPCSAHCSLDDSSGSPVARRSGSRACICSRLLWNSCARWSSGSWVRSTALPALPLLALLRAPRRRRSLRAPVQSNTYMANLSETCIDCFKPSRASKERRTENALFDC